MVASVENALMGLPPAEKQVARAGIVSALTTYQRKPRGVYGNAITPSSKKIFRTISQYKQNNNIMTTPSDKGGKIVVLDTSSYREKAYTLLNDAHVYEKLVDDRDLRKHNVKVETYLKQLKKDKLIDLNLYNSLVNLEPQTPYFFGLPKLHKPGVPLRPIIGATGSCTQKIARFLQKIFQSLKSNKSSVKNSFDFKNKIQNLKIREEEILVSFDVESLYTNVPVEFTINLINDALLRDNSWKILTDLPLNIIVDLCRLCTSANIFVYNNQFFKQIHGLPMGSPLSGVLADIYMEHFEEMAEVHTSPFISFWTRYVDDTFSVMLRTHVAQYLVKLNSIAPSIKFTHELELNKNLSFLDVLIHREDDGRLTTSVYRKPTFHPSYLHYDSMVPESYKVSVVSALLRRISLSSTVTAQAIELEKIKKDLSLCGYPLPFIQKVRAKLSRGSNTAEPDAEREERIKYKPLLYVPGLSEVLKRILKGHGITVYFETNHNLRTILRTEKPKNKLLQIKNVVYKIPCSQCPASYIGQTKRTLGTRIKEHRRMVNTSNTNSMIFNHSIENNHIPNFDQPKILKSKVGYYYRLFYETLKIKQNPNPMNSECSMDLPAVYNDFTSQQ